MPSSAVSAAMLRGFWAKLNASSVMLIWKCLAMWRRPSTAPTAWPIAAAPCSGLGGRWLHAPNRRNRKPQALHGRVDCCFAECHPLLTPWTEKFHHAGAPLEHLGPLAGGQQTAHGFAHRPPRATGGASTALGLKGEPYLSSQTSSIRAPLEMLLTMIVRPLTWGCQQVARRS